MNRVGIYGLFFMLVFAPLVVAVELPRAYIDTTFPTQTGATTVVPTTANAVTNGQAFQAALNAAQPGDTIVLQAGARYQGNFILPIKPGMLNSSWIVIQSSELSTLPAQGTRVQASHQQHMPVLVSPNSAPVVTNAIGSPAAGGYWFSGIMFTENSSYNYLTTGWLWSTGTVIRFSYGLVQLGNSGTSQDTIDEVPSRFTFDRCYFYGGPTSHIKRAISLDSSWTAIVDSRIEGMKGMGQDTQALAGWNGPGPFKIVNNHLEGSGENIMFGGADPSVPNLVPSDIEIRGNYIYKPLSWKGYWTVKNSFETKNNRRLLFEGNVLENNWADAQTGWMIWLKSSNDGGKCTWCVSEHVTVRNNILRNSYNGIAISGGDDYHKTGVLAQNNLVIENNLVYDLGAGTGRALFTIVGGGAVLMENIEIARNTAITNSGAYYANAFTMGDIQYVTNGLKINDNVFAILGPSAEAAMFVGSSRGFGLDSLNYYNSNWQSSGNIMIGATDTVRVSGVTYVARRTTDFVDAAAGNYRIAPGSPFKGVAAGGVDPGADISAVLAATSGAVTGVWGPCTVSTWTPNAAVLCGTVAQTSNCGTSRTVSGSVTCTASQACTNNVCVSSSPVVGDRNSDGRVDAVDLAIVAAALGTVSAGNDLNGDGTVNVFDLVLLTRNWS